MNAVPKKSTENLFTFSEYYGLTLESVDRFYWFLDFDRIIDNHGTELWKPDLWPYLGHSGIIFQLGYDSGHIGNPFSPLFYPHRSEYPASFHLMWPRINNQKILNPVCIQYNDVIGLLLRFKWEKIHLPLIRIWKMILCNR